MARAIGLFTHSLTIPRSSLHPNAMLITIIATPMTYRNTMSTTRIVFITDTGRNCVHGLVIHSSGLPGPDTHVVSSNLENPTKPPNTSTLTDPFKVAGNIPSGSSDSVELLHSKIKLSSTSIILEEDFILR